MAEFGALDLEEMMGEGERLKEGNAAGAGNFLDQFVPMPDVKPGQSGSVTVRILPPTKGGKLYQYNRTHKMNGRSIHCPRPLINGKWDRNVACPHCDYYSSLWKQIEKFEKAGHKDEAEKLKAEARAIKPVERYYYNAIVRSLLIDGKETKNAGPRILSVGKGLHGTIIEGFVGRPNEPDSKLGNISDLKNGWDFIIRKEVTTGEGFPKYDKSSFARNPSPAGSPEEITRWAEALHDLTKLRNPRDLEYLEKELAIHRGLIPDETEAFDTEGFDAKWRKNVDPEEVQDLMSHNTSRVTVPAGVPAATTPVVAPAPVVAPTDETIAIGDDGFLKELEGLAGE